MFYYIKFYIEFIGRRAYEKIFSLAYRSFVCLSRPQKTGYFLENLMQASFEITFRQTLFLGFLIVFHMIWKNQGSRELSLDSFWGNRHSKMQKSSAVFFCFFFSFLNCHYRFTNYFEILNFAFSDIIPSGISACEILTF